MGITSRLDSLEEREFAVLRDFQVSSSITDEVGRYRSPVQAWVQGDDEKKSAYQTIVKVLGGRTGHTVLTKDHSVNKTYLLDGDSINPVKFDKMNKLNQSDYKRLQGALEVLGVPFSRVFYKEKKGLMVAYDRRNDEYSWALIPAAPTREKKETEDALEQILYMEKAETSDCLVHALCDAVHNTVQANGHDTIIPIKITGDRRKTLKKLEEVLGPTPVEIRKPEGDKQIYLHIKAER